MRGFTLLETIAVVVLLGLATSTLAVSLAGPAEAARLRGAESLFLDFDRRARHAAVREGPVRLAVRDGLLELTGDTDDPTILASRPLPDGIGIEFGGVENELRIDALGRSEDYRIRITSENDEIRLRVAGLTGWHERLGAEAP
ncbi:MAG: type II secretion system protein [Planctomycetota bacterium]